MQHITNNWVAMACDGIPNKSAANNLTSPAPITFKLTRMKPMIKTIIKAPTLTLCKTYAIVSDNTSISITHLFLIFLSRKSVIQQ